ncbi:SDR family NAD(P)-dependent oxidoreductase [Herbidospora cretacea]|uniref:SDR family NAD(P)-dependent oxidoreductase n=1 Tax=Herbidospora cretacea TaxID=28444 RepID=UPI0007739487|nr:oxidoreductase [Herbidospora cretacea]
MDLELRDKVAVVTGASRGIGLAVTRALVEEGVRVIAGSRTSTRELEELPGVRVVRVDLSAETGPADLVTAALEHGSLDILVNNVGAVTPRLGGFLEVTDDQWTRSLTLNLMAAVRATRAALPAMIEAGRGAIVTVSSVNAFLPDPLVIDYGVAKAALTNFSKALSKEVGAHGIRVNTVSPGPVTTDLWLGDQGMAATVGAAKDADPAEVAEGVATQSETGRFTHPQEVADLVVFLASDRAGNVTGADHVIDGGLTKTV